MQKEDISDLVYNIVSENFPNLNKKDISIIEKLSIKKVLDLPYYQDFYNSSYLTIDEEEAKLSFFNEDLNSVIRNKFYDYNPDFSKKKLIILDDIKINLSKKIIGNFILSLDAKSYFEKLKEYYNENNEFRDNIENIKIFFDSYETDLLLNDFIKYNDKFKNIKNEEQRIRTNEILERDFLDSINFKFDNRKERITEDIINLSKSFINEKHFTDNNFLSEVNFVLEKVKSIRPYLNENPSCENITYEFIEINPSKKNREFVENYFVKEEDSIFKNKILSKYDISRKSLEKEENSYYNYEDILFSYFMEQPNEISTNILPKVYGLKYIDRNNFERENGRGVFLIAKKHDEIVGVVAFSSGDNLISGVHNSLVSTVKNNYRSIGVASNLYKKMSCIFNDIGLVFVNTSYTDDGSARLKHKKSKFNEEFEKCFFLDTDYSSFLNTENGFVFEDLSKRFLFIMNELNNEGKVKGNSHIFKKHYFENVKNIKEGLKDGSFNSFSYEYMIEKINKIKKDISLDIKKQNKNNNRKSLT